VSDIHISDRVRHEFADGTAENVLVVGGRWILLTEVHLARAKGEIIELTERPIYAPPGVPVLILDKHTYDALRGIFYDDAERIGRVLRKLAEGRIGDS
jgi:hypothetical protein